MIECIWQLSYEDLLKIYFYINSNNIECKIDGISETTTRYATYVNNTPLETVIANYEYYQTTGLFKYLTTEFFTKYDYRLRFKNTNDALKTKLGYGAR